jgi:hypothetical protein
MIGVAYTEDSTTKFLSQKLTGVGYTGEFGLTGVGYTGESGLPGVGYTGESRLPGVAYTGESWVQSSRSSSALKGTIPLKSRLGVWVLVTGKRFLYQGSIYWKIRPPPGGGNKYQPMSFGKKIWKGEEKKVENVKEKGRKGKEKWRKGKENEKKGRNRVKWMQNREELRQKGHDGSRKTTCRERGKKYNFQKGGGE